MNDRGAFTIDEAADWLGVSRPTVQRMIADGEIPSVPLRGRRMIARSVLERLVDPTVMDLRGVDTTDVARLVRALGTEIALGEHDAQEQRSLLQLREKLTARVAYAEALAAPLHEQKALAS